MVKVLSEEEMKLYIVSAGIRAVVVEVFGILQEQVGVELSKVVEYCMTPDVFEGEKLVDFGEPMVTSMNKHLCVNHERYPSIKEGTNAVVIGDIVEDFGIVQNLKMKTVIGIGFLNKVGEYSKDLLDKYLKVYDVVIVRDGNLVHAAELIKSIIGIPMNTDYPKLSAEAAQFAKILN